MLECPSCGAKLIFMPRVHGLCHITPYSHWERFPHVATECVTFSCVPLWENWVVRKGHTLLCMWKYCSLKERFYVNAYAFMHARTHISTTIPVTSLLVRLWISLQIFPVSGLVPALLLFCHFFAPAAWLSAGHWRIPSAQSLCELTALATALTGAQLTRTPHAQVLLCPSCQQTSHTPVLCTISHGPDPSAPCRIVSRSPPVTDAVTPGWYHTTASVLQSPWLFLCCVVSPAAGRGF